MIDDDLPAPKKAIPLDMMSIEDLEARVAAMRAEIARCETEIARKRAQRSAADSLFRSPPSA